MNPMFQGDSYDLVKRFFCRELKELGYIVVVDPMFTGDWDGRKEGFLKLIGATQVEAAQESQTSTAIFLDPDTGVRAKPSAKHASFDQVASEAKRHQMVFAFDQSFARGSGIEAVVAKLLALKQLDLHAMYYDSHARFLFAARERAALQSLKEHLLITGIPEWRLIEHDA